MADDGQDLEEPVFERSDPASADDLTVVALRIAGRLTERGETVSVCESSAGGLISAALLAVPGASRFFIGGLVVYTVKARESLLGITAADMEGIRPATEPYAALLAARCRERLGTTWSLAETGATGPAGNRYGDPAGHASLAVGGPRSRTRPLRTGLPERSRNMQAFAQAALVLLEECL